MLAGGSQVAKRKVSPGAAMGAVQNHIIGKQSASSSSLSRSYGVDIETVRKILKSNGVKDDG